MEEGHTGQPAVIRAMTQVEGRADGVPPLHSVRDDHPLRSSCGARRIHNRLCGTKVDHILQRRVDL